MIYSFFSDKIASRKSLVKSYNYDAIQLGEYWNCFPGHPRIYHHTICSTLLYGLREAIAVFLEAGGLEASWEKHSKVSNHFYSLCEANGFKLFIDDVANRCPSVITIQIPDNVTDVHKVNAYAMKHHKVEIMGGIGMTFGKIFRVGLMGVVNANLENAERVVKVLVEAIKAVENEKVVSKI